VRELARFVTQVQEKGCQRIRNSRAFRSQHAIAVNIIARHAQHARELGSVAGADLEEDDRLARRDVIILALLFLFPFILAGITAITAISDDANRAFARFVNNRLCGIV
jgi:hypothetical protein